MGFQQTVVMLLLTNVVVNYVGGGHLEPDDDKNTGLNVQNVTVPTCTITDTCAECSCRDLDDIPRHLPSNITCLNLRGNNITMINGRVLERYKHLVSLSLSNNYIHAISNNDLEALAVLEKLDLSLNNISYDKIDKDAFKSLTKLVYLDLKQNSSLNQTTYPHSLVHLTGLTRLMIDGIDSQVPNLSNLTELYLSGQYGSCNIPYIRGELFKGVPNIEYLYMSNCSVRYVEKGAFRNLAQLHALDLSWNIKLTLSPIYNITYGLPPLKFKRLDLNNVNDWEHASCTTLTKYDIENLYNTSIEQLTVEGNGLVQFYATAVQYIPKSLKYVSFRDDILPYGNYLQQILKTNVSLYMIYIDFSKCVSSHLSPAIYKCDSFPADTAIACNTDFTREQTRTYFEMMDERLSKFNITPVGSRTRDTGNEYMDISGVDFTTFQIITNIARFTGPSTFKFANMSGIYLGYSLLDSSTLFNDFVDLTTLDIRYNGIISLKPNIFDFLTNLERLYLRNNKLSNISFNIQRLHKLNYLDLNSNNFEVLPQHITRSLDMLPNITINIAGNNLKCFCNKENIDFLRWVHSTHTQFEDFNQTTCVFVNGTNKAIPHLNFDQFLHECQLPRFQYLIIVTSLCILAFIFVSFGGIIYRYRWNLRYLYYMTKFKLAGGYRSLEEDDFEKDVFVSYAEEDRIFVHDNVIQQLEDAGDFLLLLHERDFRAGEFVADNIMKAVTSTRKTLVILTRSYIQSKWCMYEMNMARLEGINANRNVLCVVLKDDIPTDHLPIEIIDIIRTHTYIEYPVNAENQSEFWQRLRVSLR